MMSLALVLAACSGNEREADTALPIEPMVKLGAEMPSPLPSPRQHPAG